MISKYKVIFDGQCSFCQARVKQLKAMDFFHKCDYIDYQKYYDQQLQALHKDLNVQKAEKELHLLSPQGRLYEGFYAFRKLCWVMPALYPLLLFVYLPGANLIGSFIYHLVAKHRYHIKCK